MQLIIIPLSIITFILFGYDKAQSRRGAGRVPEKALLILAVFGGALGGLLAMQVFRHKTKHLHFWLILSFAALVHIAIWLWNANII